MESHSIRTGQLTDDEWRKYAIAQGNLANASIYIDDTPGIRITEIRSRSRKLAQETGNLGFDPYRLLAVDYRDWTRKPATGSFRNLSSIKNFGERIEGSCDCP